MAIKKNGFGIFWHPEPQTLLVHEDFYEIVDTFFTGIKHVSDKTVLMPPSLRDELWSLVTSVINEIGVIALPWLSWVISVLWRLASEVIDYGAFAVEQPVYIFDHAFGSDTSHRVRINTD